jgi:hypothetical protein
MEKEKDVRMQQIMSQTKCDNDFRCCKLGFKNLCKAKIVGDGQLLDCSKCGPSACLRPNLKECGYHTPFGFGCFCTCPLHIYAALNPGRLL